MIVELARGLDVADLAAPAVQVADHVAHVFLGRDDLHVHDRLQHDRARFPRRFLEGEAARHLERDLRTVHFVERAVHNLRP